MAYGLDPDRCRRGVFNIGDMKNAFNHGFGQGVNRGIRKTMAKMRDFYKSVINDEDSMQSQNSNDFMLHIWWLSSQTDEERHSDDEG